MTRTLIYVIAAFALWLYFKYGTFGRGGDFGEGHGGGFGGSVESRKGGGGSSGGAGASRSFGGNRGGGFGGGNMV